MSTDRSVVWAADRPVPVGVVETAEEWRPIPGFEDYSVSNLGRVISYRRGGSPRLLRPQLTRWGYHKVHLYSDDRTAMVHVHSLAMAAFVGTRPEGHETRHLDGNKLNNAISNLQYGTRSENMLDQVAHGRHLHKRKTHCPRGHEYSAENTYVKGGTNGWRRCRTCEIDRQRVLRETAKGAAA